MQRIQAIATSASSAPRLGLGLLLELRVPGLVPDVVRLVVEYEQAARSGEAIDQRRLDGLELGGLGVLEEQLHLAHWAEVGRRSGASSRVRRSWW